MSNLFDAHFQIHNAQTEVLNGYYVVAKCVKNKDYCSFFHMFDQML